MFCLCIFESDTVKRDCLVQTLMKMMKYLRFNTDCWFTLLVSFTVFFFLEIFFLKKIWKKDLNMTSWFQSFFCPRPLIWKKSIKSTNKKILA